MRLRAISVLLAGSALALSSQAFAQQSADEENGADGPITVTGTRIVRDGYEAPTPVTVATTEDLAKSTPSNIPDALNKLPQFQNSLSPTKSAHNFSAIPIHGNVLNLRGLGTPTSNPKGPLRTLIMMDGVRVAPTTYIGTIDTNVIPNMLVQRVDVVTGGASAAWGSDAVAGVVNFVLDKKFKGLKGVAQGGVTAKGDAENMRFGLAFGTSFAEDRGHFLASAEYFQNNGLLRNQRDIAAGGYAYVGSVVGCTVPTGSTGSCTPGGSLNPLTIGQDVRITASAPFGKILATGNPFNNYKVNADGTLSPFNTGTASGTAGIQLGGDGYRIPDRTTAISPFKTYQGFARLSYDLTEGVNFYAQGIYTQTSLDYEPLANSLVQGNPTVTLYQGNPFIPAALAATIPVGGSIGFNAYWGNEQPTRVKEKNDFWQATAGLDADFGGGWKGAVSYTHGESIHNMAHSGLFDWKKFFAAVDVVTVGTTPTCRVLTDPTVAAQYAGCTPINLFNGAPINSQAAAYAYVTGTSRYRANFKHDSVVASISGSPFELPAGPVDVVLGAEYRKQSLNLTSNADPALLDTAAERSAYFAGLRGVQAASLFYWLTNVGVANGSMDVKEVFGEVAIPLMKDKPFFRELSLNGAVRLTDYSTSGSVTTWKVGGRWKPADDLTLRATWSRDIRAPNLYELFRGDTSGISIVNDPVSGLNQNASTLSGGNPFLKPEVAKTLTVGAVLTPGQMPGFSLSVDFYKIDLAGAIDALTSQQIVNNCANFGASAPECALITRSSPTAFPTLIRIAEANIAFIKTSGIDFDMSYRKAMGNGTLAVRLYANYLDKFNTQAFAGQPVIKYAGSNVVGSNPVAYPHWRGSLSVDYGTETWGINVSEQFIGGMGKFTNAANPLLSNFVNPGVNAYAYTDLNLRYKFQAGGGDVEAFVTVNNLFDKKPPIIPGLTPGVNLPTNISTYDVLGMAFTGGVRFKF
ncbi:MAG: TonB-dependent receptor plug domain-containing protein [Novosphingobium sp.]